MFTIKINKVDYTFDFQHYRAEEGSHFKNTGIRAFTECFVYKGKKQLLIANSTAHCTVTDKFVKSKGRQIALARALKELDFNKKQRTAVWNKYLSMTIHSTSSRIAHSK